MSFYRTLADAFAERERAVKKLTQDLGNPVLNRLTPDQLEFLVGHQVMHERVRQHLVHSFTTSNISEDEG